MLGRSRRILWAISFGKRRAEMEARLEDRLIARECRKLADPTPNRLDRFALKN